MYVIGLTGGIATGKSMVSRFLREEGAIVIDADRIAREVVEPGLPAWHEIVAAFGTDVTRPAGDIDRRRLGRIVFADAAARKRLNGITHPRIVARIEELLAEYRAAGTDVVVLEAPLLIEAGLAGSVDEIWVLDLDREEQVRRLVNRDRILKAEAERRIDSQLPPEERRTYADRLIDTAATEAEVQDRVRELWRDLNRRLKQARQSE